MLWNLETGAALHILAEHTDEVHGATVCANGRRALSWSRDWSLIIWDLETVRMIARFIGDAPIDPAFEAQNNLFVAGDFNGAVHILELRE